jgi:chromosome segregation ATPase
VKQLSLEIDELTERLDKKTNETTELKNKLKCCHDDKEHVTEELETLQDKMAGIESALHRAERERTGWEDKEIELSESVNKQLSEIKRLKKDLEEQKCEAENVFRRSQDEIMKAKQCSNEVEMLEAKCFALAEKLTEVERKYDAIVAERQELRREILKSESDVSQLERSLAMVNKEKAELLSEIERVGSLKNKQDGTLMKVEKELVELKEVHEQLVERSQDEQVLQVFHYWWVSVSDLYIDIWGKNSLGLIPTHPVNISCARKPESPETTKTFGRALTNGTFHLMA